MMRFLPEKNGYMVAKNHVSYVIQGDDKWFLFRNLRFLKFVLSFIQVLLSSSEKLATLIFFL